MQSSVFAFIVINVHRHFLNQSKRLAIGRLEAFEIDRENVVGFAGRDTLGEFAQVVGINVPLRLLVFGPADFHRDAINRMVVRTPDRAGDQSIGLAFGLRGCEDIWLRTDRCEDKDDWKENTERPPHKKLSEPRVRRNHRLRSPPSLLRLLRRSLLPRLSIRADW